MIAIRYGLAALLYCGTASGREQTDAGWELLVTSAGPNTPRTCYSAPKIPGFASGSFIISGPARFEENGYKFGAFTDGFGKVNKFEMSEGTMCYSSAWMDTDYSRGGMPVRSAIFEETIPERPNCTFKDPTCNLKTNNDNNWVNVIAVGGEALLLSDTATMIKLDLDTLNCTGAKTWANEKKGMGSDQLIPKWTRFGHVSATGSAHPMQRPGSSEFIDVIVEMPLVPALESNWLDIYTFDALQTGEQERKLLTSFKMAQTFYFHSYGVTPNYLVFIFDVIMGRPNIGHPVMEDAFADSWEGIRVVDSNGAVQNFDTTPFAHVHIINTFENATGIVMDLVALPHHPFTKARLDLATYVNQTGRDSTKNTGGSVRRLHFHLTGSLKGQTTTQELLDHGRMIDFVKVNPALNGLPHCIYYAVEWFHNDKNYASMALIKHDVCQDKITYWGVPNMYLSEPTFIGNQPSSGEDDGILVLHALDGDRRTSQFVSLDAKTMELLETVDLPQHIPFTAHGNFIPAKAKSSVITV